MDRVEFLIEGSQGDMHNVVFEISGRVARAACTCPAGSNRQFCKHRAAILDGDISRLRSANAESVSKLPSLLEGTDLAAAYAQFITATEIHEQAKRELDTAKKRLTRVAHQ